MSVSGKLRALAGWPIRVRVRRQLDRFLADCQDCRATQQRTLAGLLDLNRDSRFAADHGLSTASSSSDMRSALPVTQYRDYREYVEPLKHGDFQSLLGSNNRLLMFSLSSGTTSDSKFIPVTERFYQDYRRGWQLWGIAAFDAYPKMKQLKLVQLASDFCRGHTEVGTPCGNISGLAAAMQSRAVQMIYSLPYEVVKIGCPEAKYYTALRLAIADPAVGQMTTANPSTLVHLAQIADERKTDLIRDIFDGSLATWSELPEAIRPALAARLRPRRQRARELDRIVQATGQLYPRDFWQDLQFLAVWTGGSCAAYLPAVKEYFGEVPIRDHGLSASEGRMSIPFGNDSPDGVLDIQSHYYEFIPENEYDSSSPTVLEAHELEVNRDYYILLTTASGFYRYDICDVVRCTGYEGTTPIVRFLHKGAHISSITGEKLAESQVVEGVRTVLDEFNHRVRYYTLIPAWGDPPGYRLLLEERDVPGHETIRRIERRLDDRLRELNCEYDEKRGTGRLACLSVLPLKNGSWVEFAAMRQQRLGGSIEQYKHPCLLPNMRAAAEYVRRLQLHSQTMLQIPDADDAASRTRASA
ncbi:auxin-responsive protein [bacterium]|nr:auxin-responsive protein [bacterium]